MFILPGSSRLSSDPREIFKKHGILTQRRRISIDQSAACLLSLLLTSRRPPRLNRRALNSFVSFLQMEASARWRWTEKKVISLFSRAHRMQVSRRRQWE